MSAPADSPLTTGERLFGRLLVTEALARVALAIALAGRSEDERRRLIAEIRAGLVVNIVGENADQVRADARHEYASEVAKVEQLLALEMESRRH